MRFYDDYKSIMQPTLTRLFDLFNQIGISGRLQEYDPNFGATDSVERPLVKPGLESISRVPLMLMSAPLDSTCPPATNGKRLLKEIPSAVNLMIMPGENDHDQFLWDNSPEMFTNLLYLLEESVDEIRENGDVSQYTDYTGGFLEWLTYEILVDDSAQSMFGTALTTFAATATILY